MPGIAGIIGHIPPGRAAFELSRMIESMRHENSYVTDSWAEESLGIYVGWVARKGSFSDGMPLRNERRDSVLIFSGEEFPDAGIKEQLKRKGHEIHGSSASYLVHVAEEDPSFPAGLNGRFQGLLIKHRHETATLFNDRYGMHRIYYHESKDAFYFAAEAKAILALCPELRSIDPRAVGEFISCSAVLEDRTMFKGIAILPPASAWEFRNGQIERKSSYFHPKQWEDQGKVDSETQYRELRDAFTRNLPRYFNGRERVGMSLTGGLDTRMILACRKADPDSLPCYSFRSMFRENQDVRVARRLAQEYGQPFQVITAGHEFLSRFSHYAARTVYLTDGCTDVGLSPVLYVNEKASEVAPVRISGVFGGEVLRGVRSFKPETIAHGLFQPETRSYLQQAQQTYAKVLDGHAVSFAVFKQAPWYHFGILALEQTVLSVRSPYLDNDFVRIAFRASDTDLSCNTLCFRLIADGNPSLSRLPTDRGLTGDKRSLPGTLSRIGLEFLFKAEYAYDYGMPQFAARINHLLSPFHLERLFLGWHKYYHFRLWYRDILAAYVRDMLLDSRSLSRPYIERKGLEKVVKDHLCGAGNYTVEIHKALSLELLHRLFLDRCDIPCWSTANV